MLRVAILLLAAFYTSAAVAQHPAVVRVSVPSGVNTESHGSGVLSGVDLEHGYILTAHHVVRDATGQPTVTFPNGQRARGETVLVDPVFDLGLIRIARPTVEPVPLAGNDPVLGDRLTAVGYGPAGANGSGRYRETSGVLVRIEYPTETMAAPIPDWYSISAPVRPGDSGGPVFNAAGELAGVLWGTNDTHTTASNVRRLTQFAQCYGPNCVMPRPAARRVGVMPGPVRRPPPSPGPAVMPGPVPLTPAPPYQPPPAAGPAGARGPAGEKGAAGAIGEKGEKGAAGEKGVAGAAGAKGECACDVAAIVAQVEAKLRLAPIKVEILNEHGQVEFQQEVFLGGKPLQLQLVPNSNSK